MKENAEDVELLMKCYRDASAIISTRGIGEKPEDKIATAILASTLFNSRLVANFNSKTIPIINDLDIPKTT